jgi:hypothetical protein
MHNGHTIEELIQLVQRINTERGNYPNAAPHLPDPNRAESSSTRSPRELAEPVWLAVFQ